MACTTYPVDEEATETGTIPSGSTGPDTSTSHVDCMVGPEDAGSWWGILTAVDDEGAPPTVDAGLSDVIAEMSADNYNYTSVDVFIDGATVIMVGEESTTQVWLQDALGAIRVDLDEPIEPAPVPGDVVSLLVNTVRNVEMQPVITKASLWATVSTDNAVPVTPFQGALDHISTGPIVVHAFGEVLGPVDTCAADCDCLEVASPNGNFELRVPKDRGVLEGDCIEVVTPVGLEGTTSFAEVALWDQFRWY